MKNFGVLRYRYLLLVPALLVLIATAAWFRVPKSIAYWYQPVGGKIVSPLAGLAVDARTDPDSLRREYSLAYARVTWRELEPEKGVYAFEEFEQSAHLPKWRERGVRLVLRLSLDEPGVEGHMDIPDWLFEETGDGVFYATDEGSGYSPDYSNLLLQDAHGKLLEAISRRYEDSGVLAYVEMGSLGERGEWSTNRKGGAPALPMMDVASVYIWQYYSAFSNTPVLSRRPYRETILLRGGAYNPSLGDEEETWDWANLFAFGGWDDQLDAELRPQENFGLDSPSGAALDEKYADVPEMALLRMATECRATYIYGDFEGEASYLADALETGAGYRFWVRQADWPGKVRRDYSLYVDLTVRNDGVAPLPRSWPVELALFLEGEIAHRERIETDPYSWLPGDTSARVRLTIPSDMESGEYTLAIAILDPDTGEAAVRFAMEGDSFGLWSALGPVSVY